MAEYKVTQINVTGPPNEWKGPKGTVYYIETMLEGYDKIVSIGKKTPDALKVGDTVYGEIEPTDYITDKWKHGEAPQAGSSSKSPVADYEPSTNARWAIGMAYRAYVQVTGSPEGDDGNFPFDAVKTHAIALMKMFDEVKNSGQAAVPTPSVSGKEVEKPAAVPIKDKLANADWTEGLEEPEA